MSVMRNSLVVTAVYIHPFEFLNSLKYPLSLPYHHFYSVSHSLNLSELLLIKNLCAVHNTVGVRVALLSFSVSIST